MPVINGPAHVRLLPIMINLIALTLKWLAHKAGLLLLIVVVLLAASWLKSEWDRMEAIRNEIASGNAVLANLRSDLAAIDSQIAQDAAAWREQIAAATAPLLEELASLGARIERAEPLWQTALARVADLERQAREARRAAIDARAAFEALERRIHFWDKYLNQGKLVALEAARARQSVLEANARAWEAARDRVEPKVAASPVPALHEQHARLQQEIARLNASASPRHEAMVASRERTAQDVAAVEALLAAQRERVAQDPMGRLLSAVKARLPLALAILAGALALPVLIKTFLFFVLAPLAARLPPICILPDAQAIAIPEPPPSAVSVALDIAPGEELLVQADFLQSSSRTAHKRTQWFLNARLPFASLASGMVALTRIRPSAGEPGTRVAVASQQDAFGEIGVVDIPDGAAIVLQPRSLAGVVKPVGMPLYISRHWRLRSLHAWLTLQLRYLVFQGPCRLILKGCRGVRSEEPQPGQPRLVNQSATLGFSANLDYRTTRSETFVAYLRGKEDLFNDLFSGRPGRFFYEVMPAGGRRTGITGRGLEGLTDAVLKAFGI
jgi:uncharacterized protein (AIM24 family)